ncbi:MAG: regulatory protein [Ilumatobacteraceae bacterium]|jgi:anti-sigma regulatory factor (Ser/Thr protein kinase)|nr:regulatory protein [Ilumatobacteraceae bacterium]
MLVEGPQDLKAVRDSLRWLPLPAQLVADIVLAASELVTNALQYAPGPCEFSARYPTRAGAVRVEVTDSWPSPLLRPNGPAAPDAIAGRGLRIVAAIVTRWGVDHTSPDGKTVWFEVDAPES